MAKTKKPDKSGAPGMNKAAVISDFERMKKIYEEELQRKDQIIENLRIERDILIRTAMKQAERNAIVKQRISFRSKK